MGRAATARSMPGSANTWPGAVISCLALSLSSKYVSFERTLCTQQVVAAATRYQPQPHLLAPGQGLGPHIDPDQIGVAGHSQGGFAALWIGGAEINPDLLLKYQRGWKDKPGGASLSARANAH